MHHSVPLWCWVEVQVSTYGRQALYLGAPQPHCCPFYCLHYGVCPDSAPEVPKEEEENTLFLLPFPVFVLTPSRANGLDPFCFQVPLTVGSSFHLPPAHTCT